MKRLSMSASGDALLDASFRWHDECIEDFY